MKVRIDTNLLNNSKNTVINHKQIIAKTTPDFKRQQRIYANKTKQKKRTIDRSWNRNKVEMF